MISNPAAARAHNGSVRDAEGLADDVDRLMVRGLSEALAMTAKSGQIVTGFTKVEAAIEAREAVALIHASDGAADGIRKLDAKIAAMNRVNAGEMDNFPILTALTTDELDLALGRSNVVHAALLAGPASRTFLSRSQTLVRYRSADADGDAGTAARNTK